MELDESQETKFDLWWLARPSAKLLLDRVTFEVEVLLITTFVILAGGVPYTWRI